MPTARSWMAQLSRRQEMEPLLRSGRTDGIVVIVICCDFKKHVFFLFIKEKKQKREEKKAILDPAGEDVGTIEMEGG